jgi:hypothetical protein
MAGIHNLQAGGHMLSAGSRKFKKTEVKVITHNHQYEYKNWVFFAHNMKHAQELALGRWEELRILAEGIDPKEYLDRSLWVVYGPDCFPQLMLVKIINHPQCGLGIWGWSIFRRQPGFRTLGMSLYTWIAREYNPRFYLTRADALARLCDLIPEAV